MKLDDWRHMKGMSKKDLAIALGVNPAHVSQILTGRHQPKPDFAKKIRTLTKGEVTLDDIYDIPSFKEQKLEKMRKESKEIMKDELQIPNSVVFDIMCEKLFDLIKEKMIEKKESEKIETV